jgi:hypothetical protein
MTEGCKAATSLACAPAPARAQAQTRDGAPTPTVAALTDERAPIAQQRERGPWDDESVTR